MKSTLTALGAGFLGLLGPLGAAAAPGDSPAQVRVTGRTAVIDLPYRSADKLLWVSATPVFDARPFTFKGLKIKPHAGPAGGDLAEFTYTADKPGKASLTFGLVPPGKMLIGPPTLIYKGPVARKVTVQVVVK